MKLVQYNEYLVSIVDTDDLVLQHQGISIHSVDYTPQSSRKTFLATSPVGLVTDQAH